MAKPISDYTVDELSSKIKAIKAERERTANALNKYEEELERRKQEIPLGVPFIAEKGENFWYINPGTGVCLTTNTWTDTHQGLERNLNMFHSQDSVYKHAEMLLAWRKALIANAKGEPIDIQVLLPLLKKGWVWMQDDRRWYWSKEKPEIFSNAWRIWHDGYYTSIFAFNLKPSDDWKTSLMECGL